MLSLPVRASLCALYPVGFLSVVGGFVPGQHSEIHQTIWAFIVLFVIGEILLSIVAVAPLEATTHPIALKVQSMNKAFIHAVGTITLYFVYLWCVIGDAEIASYGAGFSIISLGVPVFLANLAIMRLFRRGSTDDRVNSVSHFEDSSV